MNFDHSLDIIIPDINGIITIAGPGGLIIPTGSSSDKPSGTNGLIRYNTDTDSFEYYEGGTWKVLTQGTVTSVSLSLPNIFSISGSPITSSGTLSATLVNQNANTIFAGPTTGSSAPTFRSLVNSDIPANLTISGTQGVTIPSGTTGDRSVTPNLGQLRYNTSLSELEYWTGTDWYFIVDSDLLKDTFYPAGFYNRTDSTMSTDNATHTFTISPTGVSFEIYVGGVRFIKTAPENVVFPNTAGTYMISYGIDGVLRYDAILVPDFKHTAPVASVSHSPGYFSGLSEFRYGVTMDWSTRETLFYTQGMQWLDGLDLTGYTTTGDGSLDTDAQISITDGRVSIQDLFVSFMNGSFGGDFTQPMNGPLEAIMAYRVGSITDVVSDPPSPFPVKFGTNLIQYNKVVGSTWSVEDVTDGYYSAVWVLGQGTSSSPIVLILGKGQYSTLAEAYDSNSFSDIIPVGTEYTVRPLYCLFFHASSSYTNSVKAKFVGYTDYRGVNIAVPIISHSILGDLDRDDHDQYVHIDTPRTISAQHTFSPVTTEAPFILGANAIGQLVTGFNADKLDGYDSTAFQFLDSDLTALANTSTTGVYTVTGVGTSATRTITGTTNQISIVNGNGVSGNPTISVSDNPIFSGTGSITVSSGTTGQRPSATGGKIRYNSTTGKLETVDVSTWESLVLSNDRRLISAQNVIRVSLSPLEGEFSSIASACASITTASASAPWIIEVGPGTYIEPEINVPNYVHIDGMSSSPEAIYIVPDNGLHNVFTMDSHTSLANLSVANATGTGQVGFSVTDTTSAGGVVFNKVVAVDCSVGFDFVATTSDTGASLTDCQVISGAGTIGIRITASSGHTCGVSVTNIILVAFSANPDTGILVTGPGSQIVMNGLTAEGADGTGVAIEISDGAIANIQTGAIAGWDTGLHLPNTGAATTCNANISFANNTTYDVLVEHPTAIGILNGNATRSKVDASSAPGFTALYSDVFNNECIQTGKYYFGPTQASLTDISTAISNGPTLGLYSGGTLSVGTGLQVVVAAGTGYLTDSNGNFSYVTWPQTSLSLSANVTSYIYINNSGTPSVASITQPWQTNIGLGAVTTDGSGITFLGNLSIQANNHGNHVEDYLRDAAGIVYAFGSLVSENTTPFSLDVTAGRWYYGTAVRNPSAKTAISMTQYVHSSGSWVTSTTSTLPTIYDDGTNQQTITSGKFTKHLLLQLSEGAYQSYILIIGVGQYSTEAEAEAAPLPLIPPPHNQFSQIANIIVSGGASNITKILDTRPVLVGGTGGSSSSGVTRHGDLSGLAADDHTQYLLGDGTRPMTGDLNLGSHNIVSVGTVNSVHVEAHGARHAPNGSDPNPTATAVGISPSSTNTEGVANFFSRSDHTHALTGVQASDLDLTNIAALTGTGIAVRTSNLTSAWTNRTIVAGPANRIVITNGDGVSGNPTIEFAVVGSAGTYATVTVDNYGVVTSGTTTQDWNTITNTPTTLSGYGITDAQSIDADLTALANTSTTGLYTVTGSGTSATRSLVAPSEGFTITNANAVSGNPTFVLSNDLGALESLTGTGIAVRTGTSAWSNRTISGTTNQITLTNGDGVAGNPVITISNNPILPGTQAVTLPSGSTAQQGTASAGMIRYNTSTNIFEGYNSSTWLDLTKQGTVTSVAISSSDITVGSSPITTSGTITLSLPTVNSNVGTFNNVTVNAKGLVTAASNVSYLTANQTITLSGDVTGSGTTAITTVLANTAVSSGGYGDDTHVGTFTVDSKGRLTAASNVAITFPITSVTGTSPVVSSGGSTPAISLATNYGDTQNPYSSKTANFILAAPNGSAGAPTFRAIVAADVPTLNQNTTGTASNVTGTVAIANGGTGQTAKTAAFDALQPMTTAGDLILGGTAGTGTRLGIGANNTVLTSNGTTASWAAPATNGTVTSVAISSGDLTVSGSPVTTSGTISLTLPTVNSNVGSFGDATHVGTFTVNAKGLVTAASSTSITFPVTSVASKTGAVTLVSGDVGLGNVTNSLQVINGGASTSITSDITTNRAAAGTAGRIFFDTTASTISRDNGTSWVVFGAPGTVTSVGLTSTDFSVSGSPVTTSGNITANLATTGVTATSYGDATHVGAFTVDSKGRLTAASSTAITFPVTSVNTRTGAITLTSTDVSLGNVTNDAQVKLSTVTTAGDLIVGTGSATVNRLGIGSTGNVLTVSGGTAVWAAPATNGTVTSVAISSSDITVGSSPITTSGTITLSLPTVNSNVGTFNNVTVNAKGLVTAASNVSYLTANQTITLSGDVTGSGTTAITTALSTTGVTATSYGSTTQVGTFTVDSKGRLTTAANASIAFPVTSVFGRTGAVTLTSSDVTTALTYTPVNKAGDTMTGALILNADPSAALGAATKQYVDNLAAGITVKQECRLATTAALTVTTSGTGVGKTITNAGTQAALQLDSVAAVVNDRVLVKNQTTTSDNGIYIVTNIGSGSTNWILTRATDFDGSPATEVQGGDLIYVSTGTINSGTQWVVQAASSIVVDTNPIVFVQFAGPGTYTAGTGLTLTGTQFSITNTGVTATSYGDATHVGTFTVNAQGQLTTASSTAITFPVTSVSGRTGAVTLTSSDVGLSSVTNDAQVKLSTITTAGDLLIGTGSATVSRLAIGGNGQALLSNGTTASWGNTVSTVSVVSANGFTGSVATNTTTPAITLTTSITGVLKGNGTAISAATSGTDYSSGTSALATGILKSTTTSGVLSIAVAADFPTLNQNTTGTASNVTGTVAIANGGSGQTTASAAFNVLSPITTAGDLILGTGTNTASRLGIGANNTVLTSNGTTASWAAPATNGTVTSVGVSGGTTGLTTTGGPITSSGTISLTGTLAITNGGTGQTTASTAFNALSPVTTLGDLLIGTGTNTSGRLAGNTTAVKQFLTQTGTGSVSASPAWLALSSSDVTTALTFTPYNATNPAGYTTNVGTVTSTSIVSANGFTGSVATNTTTPAITLTTSITGVLKGNGTAISAATSGTDYSAGTSALTTGILKSTTTTGALTIAVAADFPTLNQNTTGTASNVTGTVAIANGGTGQTAKTAAFDALQPMTTAGDLILGGTAGTGTRLGIGANNTVLTSNGTTASWAAPATNGTVTSVATVQPAAGLTVTGGPITSSGTLTFALANDLGAIEALNTNGILARTTTDTWSARTITGTTNQVTVTNGDGISGNPTLAISSNAILPGTASVTLPVGTTAQRPGSPTDGMLRYNTDEEILEGYSAPYSLTSSPDAFQRTLAFRKRRTWVDEFMTGGNTAPSTTGVTGYGELGWFSVASTTGTAALVAATTDHPGVLQLNTSTTTGSTVKMQLSTGTGTTLLPITANQVEYFAFLIQVPTITNVAVRIGLGQDHANSTNGTDGVYFVFNPATSANWQFLTRAAGTSPTAVTTTQAVAANTWYYLEAFYNGTSWTPVVNGTTNTAQTANVPTAVVNPGIGVTTNTIAARGIIIDYFSMITRELGIRY